MICINKELNLVLCESREYCIVWESHIPPFLGGANPLSSARSPGLVPSVDEATELMHRDGATQPPSFLHFLSPSHQSFPLTLDFPRFTSAQFRRDKPRASALRSSGLPSSVKQVVKQVVYDESKSLRAATSLHGHPGGARSTSVLQCSSAAQQSRGRGNQC